MDYSRENQRTITEIGDVQNFGLRLKIMQGHFLRNNEAYVLLHDKYELKRQIDIKEACQVYLNNQTSQTNIIRLSDPKAAALSASINQEGSSLLIKITPHRLSLPTRSFDLQYMHNRASYYEKDLLSYTYLVLKSNPSQSPRKIALKDKDVVKFGRQFYLVGLRAEKSRPKLYDRVYHQEKMIQGICRICLCGEVTRDDYLITPCMCTGSCGNIHIKCLREWMMSRVVIKKNQNIQTYNFSKMNCQICKFDLPKYVSINGSMIQILPVSLQSSLILERLGMENSNKIVHCIKLDESKEKRAITLGRSDRNDIVLDEVSISRFHAKIMIDETGASLFDCGSKYGTFVLFHGALLDLKDATFMNGKWKFEINFQNY